jgi:deaminated glutathione amidase
MVRVAVAQLCSTTDLEANFRKVAELVAKAAQAGCAMLCLPENFDWIFPRTRAAEAAALVAPIASPAVKKYTDLAAVHNIWLSLGGFHEKSPDVTKIMRNTHLLVNNHGRIVASYNKVHLFDANVPGGSSYVESATVLAGDKLVAVKNTPIGNVGLSVCYDLRFPMLYSALRFSGNADVLLIPSAFTPQTGEAHWEPLLRARAIETQCYVVAAAQAGAHSDSRSSHGHAMIIDPWGRVLCSLGKDAIDIAVADIDRDALAQVRTAMPIATHLRPDVYGAPAAVNVFDAQALAEHES